MQYSSLLFNHEIMAFFCFISLISAILAIIINRLERSKNMNWKTLLAGAAVGFATSYATKEIISRNYSISSDRVLKLVKAAFKEQGPITGSWINMQKEPYETANSTHLIYRGGITRLNEGINQSYEFLADSKTGNLLDIYEI